MLLELISNLKPSCTIFFFFFLRMNEILEDTRHPLLPYVANSSRWYSRSLEKKTKPGQYQRSFVPSAIRQSTSELYFTQYTFVILFSLFLIFSIYPPFLCCPFYDTPLYFCYVCIVACRLSVLYSALMLFFFFFYESYNVGNLTFP